MRSLQLVKEFHEKYGQPVKAWPNIEDDELNEFRLDLLYEELDELRTALDTGDEVGVLDALTDMQYVLDGAYLALGYYPLKDVALEEVHRSNMTKDPAKGKPTKGENYSPPDLATIVVNWNSSRVDD